ncbi:MAG: UDP-N-acetylmuramoyl-L-alanine--D-glutamate ligase [Peptoniphilaceae bacterium]|nr:UDP-N-acetylmuramoyl-L-alanine--D-glutamate ligase [Peptoniphilaceae bacterium]MDY6018143.1 UDP-N-acetylmuramoyl-L-alanine--D-glutamate ligase [Anaerococcus sp.]
MKKVLVYGLGLTGISAVKTLSLMGFEVFTYDANKEIVEELKDYTYSPISKDRAMSDSFEFVVKSPGIKPKDPLLIKLAEKNEIISDIELSYRLFPEKNIISITGTNGKTTTTSMITHILNESGIEAVAVGNIGQGILWQMYNKNCVFVEEISSFQLHDTVEYDTHIAAILNITEDHTDWHGSFDDYVNSKLKITQNQKATDFLIINHEDKILQAHKKDFRAQVYEFSTKNIVEKGMYLDGKDIIFTKNGKKIKVLSSDDLMIVGNHNIENAMVALLVCKLYGLDQESIVTHAKSFKAISHRLEYVKTIKEVDFYNDSKATNVDSALKAIASFDKNIILIAGGYNKNVDYRPLVEAFKEKSKAMILIGQTENTLAQLCEEMSIAYYIADDMDKAVKKAFEIMERGDTVLLSPASASWGVYKSYAQRGQDFIDKINKYELESL